MQSPLFYGQGISSTFHIKTITFSKHSLLWCGLEDCNIFSQTQGYEDKTITRNIHPNQPTINQNVQAWYIVACQKFGTFDFFKAQKLF